MNTSVATVRASPPLPVTTQASAPIMNAPDNTAPLSF
jgi:hypothetical protein